MLLLVHPGRWAVDSGQHLCLLASAQGAGELSHRKHRESPSLFNHLYRSGDQELVFSMTDTLPPYVTPVSPKFFPRCSIHPTARHTSTMQPSHSLSLQRWHLLHLSGRCRACFITDLWGCHAAGQIPISQFVNLNNQALSQSIFPAYAVVADTVVSTGSLTKNKIFLLCSVMLSFIFFSRFHVLLIVIIFFIIC